MLLVDYGIVCILIPIIYSSFILLLLPKLAVSNKYKTSADCIQCSLIMPV